MVATGSAQIQHHARKRRERTGNNRVYRQGTAPPQVGRTRDLSSHRMVRQIITDLRKCGLERYFRSWRAMTMRWIWLVPS